MTPLQRYRYVGNLVNLSTPLGLLVAKIGRADVTTQPGGLFAGQHYRLPFPVASAFTIGNVITAAGTWDDLHLRRPDLWRHEERHTWQYLYCGGLGFLGLYGLCLAWSVLRTGDRAAANFFERQAGLETGGYRDLPVRPVSVGLRTGLDRAAGWVRSRW